MLVTLLTPVGALGAALIGIGLLAVDGRILRRFASPAAVA
jgi:hypothetical protein